MKTVAITGSIASGKSLVSNFLRQQHFHVFSSDEAVHEILKHNERVKIAIGKVFSEAIDKEGVVNRKILSDIVFQNAILLKKLEFIIYPELKRMMFEFIRKNIKQRIIFFDIPLLFEKKWDRYFDYSILIKVNKFTQQMRFLRRGSNLDKLNLIRKNQLPDSLKLTRADFVINNSGISKHVFKKLLFNVICMLRDD